MSENGREPESEAGLINACPHCGSSDYQIRGTNIRTTTMAERHYRCRGCDRRFDQPTTRERLRSDDGRPSHGPARMLWEMGQEQATSSDGN